MFDGAPCERRHEMQFQSFVERYVATFFAQCRQIATVFETGEMGQKWPMKLQELELHFQFWTSSPSVSMRRTEIGELWNS